MDQKSVPVSIQSENVPVFTEHRNEKQTKNEILQFFIWFSQRVPSAIKSNTHYISLLCQY